MFRMVIETNHEEFKENPNWIVASILRDVADKIQLDEKKAGLIWNENGTIRIGGYVLKLEN